MRTVKADIIIHTTPSKVIQAFTEFELLQGWWGVERCLIDKQPGGVYALAWQISKKGFGFISSGIIKSYLSNHTLTIENMLYFNPEKPILGPMQLSITATQQPQGTLLNVTQSGYQDGQDWDWYYQAVKMAWPQALSSLKPYLEAL